MAKRRKLEAPSPDDLDRIEAEFRRETAPRGPLSAPIAQVAADSAAAHDPRPATLRAEVARDKVDAETLRDAQGRGLVMAELPIDEIDADAMVRDRVVLDMVEMDELKGSIAQSGMRLPIEVFELPHSEGPCRYGLLSGYRRLRAVRDLRALNGPGRYDRIKAVIRVPAQMGGAFAAMVEENEIRASLSQFERGRIAVIAAQQGVFVNTEAAVDALFPMASKAKRSKIRSFALIFEELGDMLTFPDQIKERDGLKLATVLRDGAGGLLREALAARVPDTPAAEAELIAEALARVTPAEPKPSRGGRPKNTPSETLPEVALKTGVTLQAVRDGQGWAIRVGGDRVDRELVETVALQVQHWLDAQ